MKLFLAPSRCSCETRHNIKRYVNSVNEAGTFGCHVEYNFITEKGDEEAMGNKSKKQSTRSSQDYASPTSDIVFVTSKKRLISNTGTAIIGMLLRHSGLKDELKKLGKLPQQKHDHFSCLASYISLLCQGYTAFEDSREMLDDVSYYCRALQTNSIPSPETLRQRMDILGSQLHEGDLLQRVNQRMLVSTKAKVSAAFSGHFPIDIDVSVHDNSDTKKEGVARAYNGIDGYAPIYAYLGMEGFLINTQLRCGTDHSQNIKTLKFLEDTIELAKGIVSGDILVRMDSGNDSKDNIRICSDKKVHFLIKRNLRSERVEDWWDTAFLGASTEETPREGKKVYTGYELRNLGMSRPVKLVYQVTVRTIDRKGQILLVPDIDVQTWWTDLELSPQEVIRLYHEHATCEQFHAEIKTDIGLERFPSGHFNTNGAVLKQAMMAYNILRIIGQTSLLQSEQQLTSHKVFRIRAKTVMKKIVLIAGHVVSHARQFIVDLGRSNIWRNVFRDVYTSFA